MTDGPDVPLLGAAEIRELAARHGIRPTKQWGQNFVVDANTVRTIVRVAGVGAGDVVVEVGPGLGSLTLALLPGRRPRHRPSRSTRVLAGALPETVAPHAPALADRLEVVLADALTVASCPGRRPTALVANLPYNVSVPVVLRFLELFPTPDARSSSWCSSRSPSGSPRSPARAPTACRASRPPGTPTCASPGSVSRSVFWPVPNVDSGPGQARPGASPRPRRPPAQEVFALRRRGVRPATQDAAGRAGHLGRLPGAWPRRPSWRPASTRAPAVSSSTSTAFAAIAGRPRQTARARARRSRPAASG